MDAHLVFRRISLVGCSSASDTTDRQIDP